MTTTSSSVRFREDLQEFQRCLARLPSGFCKVQFEGDRWGVTVRRSDDQRRIWLYAEQLSGNDVVSFNFYLASRRRPTLKPCEMSSAKVVSFVVNLCPQPDDAPSN
nr:MULTISPECIES: hypothetical protein [unclassified Rhizobium]